MTLVLPYGSGTHAITRHGETDLPPEGTQWGLTRRTVGDGERHGRVVGLSQRTWWERPARTPLQALGTHSPGNRAIVPVALPIPAHWTYDAAGIALPTDSALVMAASPDEEAAFWIAVLAGLTATQFFSVYRSFGPIRVLVAGLRTGDTITVVFRRSGSWRQSSSSPDVTLETLTFTGDSAKISQEQATAAYAIPPDVRPAGVSTYCQWPVWVDITYSGTAPLPIITVVDEVSHMLGNALVVPLAPPVSPAYTQRDATDTDHGGMFQPAGKSSAYPWNYLSGTQPGVGGGGHAYLPPYYFSPTPSGRKPVDEDCPYIHVDDRTVSLHRYRPVAMALRGYEIREVPEVDPDTEHAMPYDFGGPGWRGFRIWTGWADALAANDGTWYLDLRRTPTWVQTLDPLSDATETEATIEITPTVVMDSDDVNGDVFDVGAIAPADPLHAAFLYPILRRVGGSPFTSIDVTIVAAPRMDIPVPWSVASPVADLQVIGGVLPDLLVDAPRYGWQEIAAGTLTTVVPAGGAVVAFRPTVRGLYTVTAGGGTTVRGEFERVIGLAGTTGALSHGDGRRWYVLSPSAQTVTIATTTVTPRAYPGAETIPSGAVFGGRYAFYSYSAAEAGTLTIAVGLNNVLSLFGTTIWASLASGDIYVLDASAVRAQFGARRLDFVARTATPPASPTRGQTYVIAPDATGAWAGFDQQVARWAQESWESDGRWQIRPAVAGECGNVGTDWWWCDGSTWRDADTDPPCVLTLRVPAAGTVHVRIESHDDMQYQTSPQGAPIEMDFIADP